MTIVSKSNALHRQDGSCSDIWNQPSCPRKILLQDLHSWLLQNLFLCYYGPTHRGGMVKNSKHIKYVCIWSSWQTKMEMYRCHTSHSLPKKIKQKLQATNYSCLAVRFISELLSFWWFRRYMCLSVPFWRLQFSVNIRANWANNIVNVDTSLHPFERQNLWTEIDEVNWLMKLMQLILYQKKP